MRAIIYIYKQMYCLNIELASSYLKFLNNIKQLKLLENIFGICGYNLPLQKFKRIHNYVII